MTASVICAAPSRPITTCMLACSCAIEICCMGAPSFGMRVEELAFSMGSGRPAKTLEAA